MRYFQLHHDKRKESGLIFTGAFKKGVDEAMLGDLSLLEELTLMKALTNEGRYFTELIDRQVFMFKKSIKEIFDMYQPDLTYKDFCIMDSEKATLYEYYQAPAIKVVPAMSDKSVLFGASETKLFMDKMAVKELDGLDIFRLATPNRHLYDQYIIVSLPVAESLMRRKIPGILLTHVEVV